MSRAGWFYMRLRYVGAAATSEVMAMAEDDPVTCQRLASDCDCQVTVRPP